MGKFAKNLNLGKRVLPPCPEFFFFYLFVALRQEAYFPKRKLIISMWNKSNYT